MEFHKQELNCCYAYALRQIGVIDNAAVERYVRGMNEVFYDYETWHRYVIAWAKETGIAWATRELERNGGFKCQVSVGSTSVPLTGSGILIVLHDTGLISHAISYENGLVLDPSGIGEVETFKEFANRTGYRRIVGVVPKPTRIA